MPMRSVSGFTLIELIVVIAILAILAATALPRFIDLRQDAATATAQGMAGALASGTSINFGARSAGNAAATAVLTCNAAVVTVQGGTIAGVFPDARFAYKAGVGVKAVTNGASTVCSVVFTQGTITATAGATIIGAA